MEWLPIETAPRDGTEVLVWFSEFYNGMQDIAQWDDDRYAKKPRPYWSGRGLHIWGIKAYREGKPTHWMPLPPPPKATE